MPDNLELSGLQLNIDRILTNYSQGIKPLPGVGSVLFPRLMSPTQKVDLAQWGYEAFAIVDDEIGSRALPEMVDVSLSKTPLTIATHARMAEWDAEEQAAAQRAAFPWDFGLRKQYVLNAVMDLREEYLAATLAQNPSLYGSNYTNCATANIQFDDDSANPLLKIVNVIEQQIPEACNFPPNVGVIAMNAWAALKINKTVIAAVRGINNPQAPLDLKAVGDYLGLDQLVIGRVVGRDVTTGVLNTRLWDKSLVLAYVDIQPSLESFTYGRSVEWDIMGAASVASPQPDESAVSADGVGGSRAVSKWFDAAPGGLGVWRVKQARYYTKTILASRAGWLFDHCVA